MEEAFQPGVTVVDYARQQGLCASLLHRWRRQARQVAAAPSLAHPTPTFVPIALVSEPPIPAAPACPPAPSRSGVMEIDLGRGYCVRVDRDVDAEALRRVLQVLKAP